MVTTEGADTVSKNALVAAGVQVGISGEGRRFD